MNHILVGNVAGPRQIAKHAQASDVSHCRYDLWLAYRNKVLDLVVRLWF